MSSIDGIAQSGKTKSKGAKIQGPIKGQDGDVSKGGKASTVSGSDMKKVGRNMARAKNQG